MTTAIEQTLETYGIENWGAGYFDVNRKGHLIVHPAESDPRAADLKEIIDDLARRGVTAPVLLRFPQLVAGQVRKLQRAFSKSIREFEYQGAHMCVYPMKVNQQRSVVEEYLREGSRYDFGLEAGSKAELYVMRKLDSMEESINAIHVKLGQLNCAVHIERLRHIDETIDSHTADIGKIKNWRAKGIGGMSVVIAIWPYVWSKLSKLF